MQTQPSPQGIASLYMGNPGALQQKVQKEQQAKPGLPPDLKNLLALNIVTNEQDAAKRQQAMNALNQMAPAGQQPPTVAQSLQEQAKQKLQAQMLQQQRQQQGLAALAEQNPSMEVPGNTPQPEPQPQGIDELPVDMQFAGGGIVAFAEGGTYETSYDRMNRENREREEREREERLESIRSAGNETMPYGEQMENLGRFLNPVRAFRRLVGDPTLANEDARGNKIVSQVPAGGPELPRGIAGARRYPGTPDETQQVIANREVPKPRPAPAGIKAAAPAPTAMPAPVPAAPAKSLEDLIADRMKLADAQRDKEMERYGKLVGRPDTAQYDRLVAELEGRRKQFDAPAQGWDAFAEYMGQIAAQGPQRTWYEAGAKGAAAQRALDRERQTQQFELTKQMVDVAQKKIEADRAYNKELYATGESAAKRIDGIAKEVAQEAGLDRRKADEFANAVRLQEMRDKSAEKIARIGAESRAAGGDGKQTLAELKALQTSLKDQLALAQKGFDPASRAAAVELRRKLADVDAVIAQMAGLGTMVGAPGAQGPGGTTRMRFDAKGNLIQ